MLIHKKAYMHTYAYISIIAYINKKAFFCIYKHKKAFYFRKE
jgi:hypothetical protein